MIRLFKSKKKICKLFCIELFLFFFIIFCDMFTKNELSSSIIFFNLKATLKKSNFLKGVDF